MKLRHRFLSVDHCSIVSVYIFRVHKSASDATMCAQNEMTWPSIFNETENLTSSPSTGICIALLCMPRIYLQNLIWAFSCGCLYPVLLL